MHKTITFDFAFSYSRAGNYDEENSITVCEPNWHHKQIYTTIRSYLGETNRSPAACPRERLADAMRVASSAAWAGSF
jgi:hypothetical protein